jgi:peptide-methionine (S)-S-oxide reductase
MGVRDSKEPGAHGVKQDPVFSTAMFAAGCFWGVEQAFRQIPGVVDVTSGYAGGGAASPTYHQVSTGRTGHAESVRVVFNPAIVSYQELLRAFWEMHDPTQVGGQGPDMGSQYRSIIFYSDEKQRDQAEASREALERAGHVKRPIVTEIMPAGEFWPAEEYHQRFFEKNRH